MAPDAVLPGDENKTCNHSLRRPREISTQTDARSQEICRLFTKGKCPWGAKCHRLHPSRLGPQTEDPSGPPPYSSTVSSVAVQGGYGGGRVLAERRACTDDKLKDPLSLAPIPTTRSRVDLSSGHKHDCDASTVESCEYIAPSSTPAPEDICTSFFRWRCPSRKCRKQHITRAEFRQLRAQGVVTTPADIPLPESTSTPAILDHEPSHAGAEESAHLREILRSLQSDSNFPSNEKKPDPTQSTSYLTSVSDCSRDCSSSPVSQYRGWQDSFSDASDISSSGSFSSFADTPVALRKPGPDSHRIPDSGQHVSDIGIVIRLPLLASSKSTKPNLDASERSTPSPRDMQSVSDDYSVKLPSPAATPARARAIDFCLDWMRGRCYRQQCKYRHELPAGASNSRIATAERNQAPTAVSPRAKPCRHWLAGHCQKDDCTYPHSEPDGAKESPGLVVQGKPAYQLLHYDAKAQESTSSAAVPAPATEETLPADPDAIGDGPSDGLHLPRHTCWAWLRGGCPHGDSCKYAHGRSVPISRPLVSAIRAERLRPSQDDEEPIQRSARSMARGMPPSTRTPPVHKNQETSHAPRRQELAAGDHRLQQDNHGGDHGYRGNGARPTPPDSVRPPNPRPYAPYAPKEYLTFTICGARVTFGPGFAIKDVITNLEACSRVVLSGLLPGTTQTQVFNAIKHIGGVGDIKLVTTSNASRETSVLSAQVTFMHHSNATHAAAALDGFHITGQAVSAHLSTSSSMGQGVVDSRKVELEWDAPDVAGFAGYASLEQADAVITAIHGAEMGGGIVRARLHSGLPTLGKYTVRFAGLPPNARMNQRKYFGKPEGTMLRKPKYPLSAATAEVQALVHRTIAPEDSYAFVLEPPPYRDGMVRASVSCSSTTAARNVAATLDGYRSECVGETAVRAFHMHNMSYRIPNPSYRLLADDISVLANEVAQDRCSVRVLDPESEEVDIDVTASCARSLRTLNRRFDVLLRGEIVSSDGVPVWDDTFLYRTGYLGYLGHAHPLVLVQRDQNRRTIKLFGPLAQRTVVAKLIIEKVRYLQDQAPCTFPLQGRLIGLFMTTDLHSLRDQLGRENVWLDRNRKVLTIRGGGERASTLAKEAIARAESRYPRRLINIEQSCTVCFTNPDDPILLSCGHRWCRACFVDYLGSDAALHFPLTCLGADAKCGYPIPIALAQEVLSKRRFDETCQRAFNTYIRAHPEDLSFCPTPDCPQVYRTLQGARNERAVVQCPTCLTRICAHCRVEAHDEMRCEERGEQQEALFKQWTAAHDVKPCPKCNAHIERDAGCNHMTCVVCKTHICWVCMETFPDGHVIYDHMRAVHGGIGL